MNLFWANTWEIVFFSFSWLFSFMFKYLGVVMVSLFVFFFVIPFQTPGSPANYGCEYVQIDRKAEMLSFEFKLVFLPHQSISMCLCRTISVRFLIHSMCLCYLPCHCRHRQHHYTLALVHWSCHRLKFQVWLFDDSLISRVHP